MFKFFKRQRSNTKSVAESNNQNNNRNHDYKNNNNNALEEHTNEEDNDFSFSGLEEKRKSTGDDEPVFSQSLNETSTRPESLFLKEPKGWRKSLRKLRRKKHGDKVSNSYDSILSSSGTVGNNVNNHEVDNIKSDHISKRWSYSPDLNEETVPGAKELRGCLERKLSVKLEEYTPETSPKSPYFSQASPPPIFVIKNSRTPEANVNNNHMVENFDHDKTIVNEDQEIHDTPRKKKLENLNLKIDNIPVHASSLNDLHSSENDQSLKENKLYQSHPTLYNKKKEITKNIPITQNGITNSENGESNSMELYTPEEDLVPYGFDDIDDILTQYPSRAATLRNINQEQLRSGGITEEANFYLSNLQPLPAMKDRSGTLIERQVENALENYDQQTDNYGNTSNDPYIMPSENEDGNYDAENDEFTKENESEDNLSWPSNEFDSDSEIDPETTEDTASSEVTDEGEKSFVSRKQRVPSLSKDITKEVQKFKFWERSSTKKKLIAQNSTKEEEPSLFVEVHISPQKHPGPYMPSIPPGLEKYQIRRRKIVETIIQSEGSYIDSLQRLELDYKQALLEQKPPILSSEVVERIFYKIADILQCHQLFQIALAASVAVWDDHECIGQTFVASFSKSMVLECYSEFINNFTLAMDTVRKMCVRKPQFLTFLRDKQSGSSSRLNLYGLMLKPVQRFPQFIMIVQDLLKHTPTEHPDRLPLQLALTELETLAENLNQRRADDEEKAEMNRLIEASNIKLPSTTTKDGRQRRVLKQGELREWVCNEEGLIEKMKDCLLVLTNDMLLCCGISNRRTTQRTGTSTTKDMYKLKWRVSLDVLSVIDNHVNESQTNNLGPMAEDFAILSQIGLLVNKLQLPHKDLTPQKVESWINDLKGQIQQAEQIARQPTELSFTVHFPEKSGDIHRMLVCPQPSVKDEWLEAIYNAQRANAPENLNGWYTADGSGSESLWPSPLYLREVLAHPNQKSLQVQCAFAFMPASHVTLLWLSCAASTVLAVVSVYYIVDDKIERVHVMQVESSVQCIEKWNPFDETPSVWLGMESGCLIEYSTESTYHKMCEVVMPTMSTVMLMKGYEKNLYVGLLDGTLAMYTRSEGSDGLDHITSITAGNGPLNCLAPAAGKLWGSCGNDLVTINLETFTTETTRTLPTDDPSLVVSHVVQVGCGLWVAFCNNCSLHLYHLDSLKLLQDLNLSRIIRDFMQDLGIGKQRISEPCHVTCLWSSYSHLLVGTNNGLILAMPLPKLPGSVPKITGSCKVGYHTLRGPVSFLCAPEMPIVKKEDKKKNKEAKSNNSTPPLVENENEDAELPPPPKELLVSTPVEEDPDVPPKIPERSPIKITFNKHKRTTSDGSIARSHENLSTSPRPFSSFSPDNNRLSVDIANLDLKRKISPPKIPPRPSELAVSNNRLPPTTSCNRLEDDKVYENKNINPIQSPRKASNAPWDSHQNLRDCPVIIACGDGYKYLARNKKYKDHKQQDPSTAYSPAIICWKIMS